MTLPARIFIAVSAGPCRSARLPAQASASLAVDAARFDT